MSALISAPVRGRKVVRTVTAPTIMRPSERLKRMSLERPSEPDKETLRFPEQSVSLYELNGQCASSPDHLSRSLSRTEIHSKYSLRQQMKETMASITPSDPTTPPQRRHRREITRCWSRERVIRSEVILSIRRPMDRSMNELSIPTEQHTIPHKTPIRSCSARHTGTRDDHSGQSTAFSSSHSLFAVASAVGKRIPIRTCYTNTAEIESPNVSFQVVPMEPSSSQVQPIVRFAKEQIMQTPEEYVTDMTPIQKISVDSTTTSSWYSVDSTPKLSITQSPSFIDHSTQVELDEFLFAHRSQWNTDSEPDLFTQLKTETELYNNLSIFHTTDFGQHPSTVTEDNSTNSLYSTASSSLPSNKSSSASSVASSNDSPTSLIEDDNQPMDQTKTQEATWTQRVETVQSQSDTCRNLCTVSHFEAIVKRDATGYGLRVCGNKPVSVHSVRQGGTAEEAGLQPGDQIIKVNGELVELMNHDDVVALIKAKPIVCFLLRRQSFAEIQPVTVPNESDCLKQCRQLTANEDPMLRSQSRRHYNHKRRRDSFKRSSGSAAAIQRRARITQSAIEPLENTASSQTNQDSASDSTGPYTDEDLESLASRKLDEHEPFGVSL